MSLNESITKTIREELAYGFESYLGPYRQQLADVDQSMAQLAQGHRETIETVDRVTAQVTDVTSVVQAMASRVDTLIVQLEHSSKALDRLADKVDPLLSAIAVQQERVETTRRMLEKTNSNLGQLTERLNDVCGRVDRIYWTVAVILAAAAIFGVIIPLFDIQL